MDSSRTKSFLLFLFLVTVLAMPSAVRCQEIQLRVVYTDWFPYTYQKDHTPSGFEIDIFNSIMKKMAARAEFKTYPWGRCLNYLKSGKADILISMLKTPEREEFTDYPDENISISRTMFFKKRNTDIAFDGSYEKLRCYNIGVIKEFSYGDSFDQASYLKTDDSINTRMLVTKLLRDRNDLAAENQAVVIATALQMGVADQIEFFGPPIHVQKLYVGFSKASGLGDVCRDFSILLREFKRSETYHAILKKYGITHSEMLENIE